VRLVTVPDDRRMLGKPSRRTRKKLEAHGRIAPAVVLEISERGMSVTNGNDSIVANTEVVLKARLRVEPEGVPAFEVHQRFRFPQLAVPGIGSHVSVRYDPDDHDNIMIDDSQAAVLATMSARTGLDLGGLLSTIRDTKADHPGDRPAMQQALLASLGQGAAVVPMPMPAPDATGQSERLAELHASGALTDDEFSAAKARILADG
jgi:putative oligomerization/nucleic acid binding protein